MQRVSKALFSVVLLFVTVGAFGQTASSPAALTNFYGIGGNYNGANANPSFSGSAFWAHKLADTGTFSFTGVDAYPISVKPFTVVTNTFTGVLQRVLTVGKVDLFITSGAGVSVSGQNVGLGWNAGGAGVFKIKNNIFLATTVRVQKSAVSNGAGYQLQPGISVVWGQ